MKAPFFYGHVMHPMTTLPLLGAQLRYKLCIQGLIAQKWVPGEKVMAIYMYI